MGATDLPLDVVQTDETGETVVVSNAEFLHALFSDLSGDAAPVVTSFAGNPTKVPAAAWQSRRWRDGEHALPEDTNNYFSLASFRPDEAGVHRRRGRAAQEGQGLVRQGRIPLGGRGHETRRLR